MLILAPKLFYNIVCILMLVSTPMREERSDWRDIYGENKRAKDRALRNPRCG